MRADNSIGRGLELMDKAIFSNVKLDNDLFYLAARVYAENFQNKRSLGQFVMFISFLLHLAGIQGREHGQN
jgi:hypothetical protein